MNEPIVVQTHLPIDASEEYEALVWDMLRSRLGKLLVDVLLDQGAKTVLVDSIVVRVEQPMPDRIVRLAAFLSDPKDEDDG